MRRNLVQAVVAAAVLSSLIAGAVAYAATATFGATMTPQQVISPTGKRWQVPPSVKAARGTLTATLAADGRTLNWRITYAKVAGSVIADIHIGRPGTFGAVLGRLCSACRSGQKGHLKLTRNAAGQVRLNNTWVALITPKYPNGIVRGQITRR
jgi:hypothetical protein